MNSVRTLRKKQTDSRCGGRKCGGTITLDSPESSQFISALLLVAPCFSEGLELQWTGLRLSGPYVRMTLEMLGRFGAHAFEDDVAIRVESGPLTAAEMYIPADWSAAAFWFEVAALAPGTDLHFIDMAGPSLQGDEEAISLSILLAHALHPFGKKTHPAREELGGPRSVPRRPD